MNSTNGTPAITTGHTLSVIVITHNEGHQLAACLESVRFANELIIIDSESTDNTVEVAKRYTPKVYNQPWQGFGRQKQIALNHATGDWVLSLDADEILSPALQKDIQTLLISPNKKTPKAYQLRCITSFCGKPIYYGDWRGEAKLRLFQRNVATFTDDVVHEKLVLKDKTSPIGKLPGILFHNSYPDLKTTLEKIQRYSGLGAEKQWKKGKKASFGTALGHGLWAFIRGYILKFGFLDGIPGFLVAYSRMEETFYRYLKLRELCQRQASDM